MEKSLTYAQSPKKRKIEMGRSKQREFQAVCVNLVTSAAGNKELTRQVRNELREKLGVWTDRVSYDGEGSVDSSEFNRKSQEKEKANLSGKIRFQLSQDLFHQCVTDRL